MSELIQYNYFDKKKQLNKVINMCVVFPKKIDVRL